MRWICRLVLDMFSCLVYLLSCVLIRYNLLLSVSVKRLSVITAFELTIKRVGWRIVKRTQSHVANVAHLSVTLSTLFPGALGWCSAQLGHRYSLRPGSILCDVIVVVVLSIVSTT